METTDTQLETIDRAFEDLDAEGVKAEANCLCCMSCACAKLGTFLSENPDYTGAVYYHEQDLEGFVNGGDLFIGFLTEDGEGSVAIAETTVEKLEAAGLTIEWDGTSRRRIRVKNKTDGKRYPSRKRS